MSDNNHKGVRKVYISGPYTNGSQAVNLNKAINAAKAVMQNGEYPIVPHLSHYLEIAAPQPYEFWLQMDMALLESCDAILRLPGESAGADMEVELAKELELTIYYGLSDYMARVNHEKGSVNRYSRMQNKNAREGAASFRRMFERFVESRLSEETKVNYPNSYINHATLALNEEAGEIAGLWKKYLYGKIESMEFGEKATEELADLMFYMVVMSKALQTGIVDLYDMLTVKLADGHGWTDGEAKYEEQDDDY